MQGNVSKTIDLGFSPVAFRECSGRASARWTWSCERTGFDAVGEFLPLWVASVVSSEIEYSSNARLFFHQQIKRKESGLY
mgnify:CR=1 FL=1